MKTKQFEDYTDEEICRLVELGIAVLPNLKQGPLTTFNSLTIKVMTTSLYYLEISRVGLVVQ